MVLAYEVSSGLVFGAAGAYLFARQPRLLHRQLMWFMLLSVPLMALQLLGVGSWTQVLRNDFHLAGESSLQQYPTLFVPLAQIVPTTLQMRPAGFMHANNYMSLFIAFALAVHYGRTWATRMTLEGRCPVLRSGAEHGEGRLPAAGLAHPGPGVLWGRGATAAGSAGGGAGRGALGGMPSPLPRHVRYNLVVPDCSERAASCSRSPPRERCSRLHRACRSLSCCRGREGPRQHEPAVWICVAGSVVGVLIGAVALVVPVTGKAFGYCLLPPPGSDTRLCASFWRS